ncbi:DUF1178 family protein [Candidatus Pelagibacter communis]|uniref:DUF1178 family protein n=1 Tax=Pelagibacter ubique TaxID=198252 RepID=UPI00094D277A|nr:DUF1178 family protein [Candidatus Pelagibacter ubique]
MIKYSLNCRDCNKEFESWFGSSKEYDRLKKMKLLNCQNCSSLNVEKSLMAPNLSKTKKSSEKNEFKLREVKQKLKEYKKFVKENFDFVGDNFTYEARSIHYNKDKKKLKKGIYGKASIEDIRELKDEGIETEMMPWIEDKDN